MAHNLTATLLQETCERLIGEAKASLGAAGVVYQILMGTPGVLPDMDAVAAAMNMTNRTLRRRLLAKNTSFAKIIDDVRSSLALEYLKTTKMSADDIATLLGFSDSAAFRKALKRWTEKGLGELRVRGRYPRVDCKASRCLLTAGGQYSDNCVTATITVIGRAP